jgi:hypothetical protein
MGPGISRLGFESDEESQQEENRANANRGENREWQH